MNDKLQYLINSWGDECATLRDVLAASTISRREHVLIAMDLIRLQECIIDIQQQIIGREE
jgi:hypothetical protein